MFYVSADSRNGEKSVKSYTLIPYQDTVLKRLRAQDRNSTYVWKLHRENKPCKVLSIRAYQGHLGRENPTFGNRLVIQALVKFDTSQVCLCALCLHSRGSHVDIELASLQQKGKASGRRWTAQACCGTPHIPEEGVVRWPMADSRTAI